MTNTRVARRYAEALVELAEQGKTMATTVQDLETIREPIRSSREFQLFLKSPVINKEKKREVLHALFKENVLPATLEAVDVIVQKGREDLLAGIIDQFFLIRDEREGIVRVQIRTASEFSGDQTKTLTSKLERYTAKTIRVTFLPDKQLIGGFVARVGDTVFDGSVKRQLELLKLRFAEGNGADDASSPATPA